MKMSQVVGVSGQVNATDSSGSAACLGFRVALILLTFFALSACTTTSGRVERFEELVPADYIPTSPRGATIGVTVRIAPLPGGGSEGDPETRHYGEDMETLVIAALRQRLSEKGNSTTALDIKPPIYQAVWWQSDQDKNTHATRGYLSQLGVVLKEKNLSTAVSVSMSISLTNQFGNLLSSEKLPTIPLAAVRIIDESGLLVREEAAWNIPLSFYRHANDASVGLKKAPALWADEIATEIAALVQPPEPAAWPGSEQIADILLSKRSWITSWKPKERLGPTRTPEPGQQQVSFERRGEKLWVRYTADEGLGQPAGESPVVLTPTGATWLIDGFGRWRFAYHPKDGRDSFQSELRLMRALNASIVVSASME